MTLNRPNETFVRSNADLTALWREMMGPWGFEMRSLWHIFLGVNGQQSPVVLPIDDLPLVPDPEIIDKLVFVMRDVLRDQPGHTVATLLSRPGRAQLTDSDRAWARAVVTGYGRELSPWPMHLATRGRVQVFAPDDLIAAS